MLDIKQKVLLKKIAQTEDILKFNIGKETLNNDVITMLDNAIKKHELIKVYFLKSSLDNKPASEIILDLSSALKCDVVQYIGHTVTLYRKNPKLTNSYKI